MKKGILLSLSMLLVAGFVFAQNATRQAYIVIPAGNNAVATTNASTRTTTLSGTNFSGIKVGDKTLNSNGNTTISISADNSFRVVTGTLGVTDASGRTTSYGPGSRVTFQPVSPQAAQGAATQPASEEEAAAEGDVLASFVAVNAFENTTVQQASANVVEQPVLSPSAP